MLIVFSPIYFQKIFLEYHTFMVVHTINFHKTSNVFHSQILPVAAGISGGKPR